MSKEYFSDFTRITLDNIKDFFGYDTLFLIANKNNDDIEPIRIFFVDQRRIIGNYLYRWYWDSEVKRTFMKIINEESLEDHLEKINGIKKLIKQEIGNGRVYAKRV